MAKILILGASGAMAQLLTKRLLNETDDQLVLFLRHAERVAQYASDQRVTIIEGDVLDTSAVIKALANVDVVYSNLGGINLDDQMRSVLLAMKQAKQTRLIYISSLGAHHEVAGKFGQWNEQAIKDYLPGFRKTAELVANSGLTYTEIRPAWLTNQAEVSYEITRGDESFKGTEVARQSVADFAFKVIQDPTTYQNESVGLNKPNTDGDKPNWI